MKGKKVHRRLERSVGSNRVVTVVRDRFELMMTDGFVIALTDQWVLLHSLADGIYLDDVVALRRRDISAVLFRCDDAYHHRGLTAQAQSVVATMSPADLTATSLLAAAEVRREIVAVHLEALKDEPLLVGRILKVRKRIFELHYVGRDGVWASSTERWHLSDVTRIEAGGRYLRALNDFADAYPPG